MFYIICFILLAFLFMFIEKNIGIIIFIMLLLLVLAYIYSVYIKSSSGKKRKILSQIKKEEKLIKKNEYNIRILTELQNRLNNLGIYPTRIVTHDNIKKQIIYVDENNKKMYLELLYEKHLINTDEIIDFELVENQKPLFKYTLNTALTGKFKVEQSIDDLRLIIYLDNANTPIININCLGTLYDFNRDVVIYNSKNFAYEVISVLKSLKESKSKTKKYELISIVPDKITDDDIKKLKKELKSIKSEPFIVFLKKYYSDKWKNSKIFRLIICSIILLFVAVFIVNIVNNNSKKNHLDLYEKLYTPTNEYSGTKYVVFHDDSIEVAFKKEDGTYYYHEYDNVKCDVENSNLSFIKEYSCTIDNYHEILIETNDNNDCATISGGVHYDGFNYSDGSFKYCVEENIRLNELNFEKDGFCKGKGILCKSTIDKSLSGYYITSNVANRDNIKFEEYFSIIYLDEDSHKFVLATKECGCYNYMDLVEEINSFDPNDISDYAWDKVYNGSLEKNGDGSYTLLYEFYNNKYKIKINWNEDGKIIINKDNIFCSNIDNQDCNILTNTYVKTYEKYK